MSESHHPKVSAVRVSWRPYCRARPFPAARMRPPRTSPQTKRAPAFVRNAMFSRAQPTRLYLHFPPTQDAARRAAHALTLTHRQPSSVPHTQVFT